jgi:hypothetical protein
MYSRFSVLKVKLYSNMKTKESQAPAINEQVNQSADAASVLKSAEWVELLFDTSKKGKEIAIVSYSGVDDLYLYPWGRKDVLIKMIHEKMNEFATRIPFVYMEIEENTWIITTAGVYHWNFQLEFLYYNKENTHYRKLCMIRKMFSKTDDEVDLEKIITNNRYLVNIRERRLRV